MTEPNLNQRAAKAMGWHFCVEPGCAPESGLPYHDGVFLYPTCNLDHARLVVLKAIEVSGLHVYTISLAETVREALQLKHLRLEWESQTFIGHLLLATAEQQTRAALAVIEAKGGDATHERN